jgi:N-acetyl-anhydromuramyl-L-alanine amidase AmpD
MNVIELPADMFHYGVHDELDPRFIVLHATAGTDSRKWLTTTSRPPVSIHRLIRRDGYIYKIVPDNRQAWHVGRGMMFPALGGRHVSGNVVCLGIELENLNDGKQAYTAEQYNATAEQIVTWRRSFGYLPVLGHAAVDYRKSDPRAFDWYRLESLVVRFTESMAVGSNG